MAPPVSDTASVLMDAARELFAERGFDGASVRAITERAGVNLGAVTYHFGSKEALYHRVIETFLAPLRERVVAAAAGSAPPLDRIEAMLGAAFDHYASDPAMPRLILQQVASGRPAPPPARAWIRQAVGLLAGSIAEGQADGSVRAGDPRLLALAAIAPSVFVHLIRRPIEDSIDLTLSDPATHRAFRSTLLECVRAGLAAAA
ncbi:MAG TPA: TetR/AcrR family transcriptional regulator [Gemmatimonadota bacterium]|nr:TetR/AcrR family transcriptional regulator [Gemmatimonadota bacterium]